MLIEMNESIVVFRFYTQRYNTEEQISVPNQVTQSSMLALDGVQCTFVVHREIRFSYYILSIRHRVHFIEIEKKSEIFTEKSKSESNELTHFI